MGDWEWGIGELGIGNGELGNWELGIGIKSVKSVTQSVANLA